MIAKMQSSCLTVAIRPASFALNCQPMMGRLAAFIVFCLCCCTGATAYDLSVETAVSRVKTPTAKRLPLPISTPTPHIDIPVVGLNRSDAGPLIMETRTLTVPTPIERLEELPFNYEISRAAKRQQLDPALVHAVITIESRHNAFAVSPKGAMGLMQLMPETADRFGVRDRRAVAENVRGGTAYLRFLVDLFAGNLELALAAYNAGEQAVIKNGNRIPPYPETLDYVPKVLDAYKRLRGPALIATGATVTREANGRMKATIPAARQ